MMTWRLVLMDTTIINAKRYGQVMQAGKSKNAIGETIEFRKARPWIVVMANLQLLKNMISLAGKIIALPGVMIRG